MTQAPSCALAAPLAAQHSLIISPDVEFALRGNFSGTSAMGLVDDQETIIVTPDAGAPYDARAFRTFNMMNVMHGDGDLDGDLDDTDLYGDLNSACSCRTGCRTRRSDRSNPARCGCRARST